MNATAKPPSAQPTDEQLARLSQGGCRASFEQLVRRYQVPLLRFVRERVHSDADAEDVVQDTFVRAFQRIDRYNDAWRFSTWLFTIGHRLAISHLRSKKPRREAHPDEMNTAPDPRAETQPGRRMAEQESRLRFWDAAAEVLTDEQMAAVWLYYVEDMAAPEVAKVLDRSWVSVKTMLFRARRKLEPTMAALHPERSPRGPVADGAGVTRGMVRSESRITSGLKSFKSSTDSEKPTRGEETPNA